VIAKLVISSMAKVAAGRGYLPPRENVFQAFTYAFADVRVLIVGQDPYPSLGHPSDLRCRRPGRSTDPEPLEHLQRAAERRPVSRRPARGHGRVVGPGVMLLSRVLTVQPGGSGSHRRTGWEAVTATAIHALADRGGPLVAILWGRTLSPRPVLSSIP
jgi:uracil-DNA glycosylase